MEEIIKEDIAITLADHYEYGEASIEQFWRLEGEDITDRVYSFITEILMEKAQNYTNIIGSEL